MARRQAQKHSTVTAAVEVESEVDIDKAPYWDFFFRDQRSPLLRSQLVTALMAGKQMEVERLPAASLLDVVVMSSATRNYHEAEIIDDFHALLRRTSDAWKSPTWCRKTFDQTHANAASFILMGLTEFVTLEDSYIPDLVGWLLEHDPPEYFTKELVQ